MSEDGHDNTVMVQGDIGETMQAEEEKEAEKKQRNDKEEKKSKEEKEKI
jgi:hypothetical protein